MSCFAAFDATAGALQLVVPSYGLKLVRRFGTHRVGWFLVIAFASLASLHLLEPVSPIGPGFGPDPALDIVYGIGSVLLLIGMGHMQTLFSQGERARSTEESLNQKWEQQIQKKTASLTEANEALQRELLRRRQAEAILKESEEQYRFVFTDNPQPMWIFDLQQRRFLAVNKAAVRHYGFTPEEFMRLSPQDLLPREQVDAFIGELAQSCARSESRGLWQHYRKDQSLIDVELSARDLDYGGARARLVVINDLTQSRRREGEVFQARKMEFMSRVAGATAYRFNDILSVIEGHTAILRQNTQDAATAERLQELSVVTTRGTNLGYQLLSIGGRQVLQPRPLDLNRLISNLNLILRRVAGEKIVFKNAGDRNPLPVMADPKVLEQVLINLVKNARDAMPEKGILTVSTAMVRVENPPLRENADSELVDFARISVRDTGCGIAPEIQERLFEPFFTTKGPDKGQGLGLACIFGAVRQHWGWIECASEVGAGTEFRIFLPCISKELLPSASEMQAATTVNRGTVLLVDADERSRGVARYILNRNGYRVIEADSSSIAMVLWEGQARNIDLVLADLALTDSPAFDLANQLRQTRPDLKVVFACGSEEEFKKHEAVGSKENRFIGKPYQAEQLVAMVEAAVPQEGGTRESKAAANR
ncbi:MAG TPA: ATP-binding protein [Candidatus Angelobacter sp.]|nr:ATP-binding protein [Candidatus Angelobacter sp.]